MSRLWIVAAVAGLVACSSDKDVGDGVSDGEVSTEDTCAPGNMPPYAHISSHVDGAVVGDGETQTYTAIVGDPDDALDSLSANWYVDGVLVCEDAPIDADGFSACEITASGDTSVIRIEVTDPDGATDEDVVVVVAPGDGVPVNTPPSCEITAPPSGLVGDVGAIVRLQGQVADAEDPPSALSVTWASDTLGILGSVVADEAGSVAWETDLLTVGAHILVLSVTDTAGANCVDWISYRVQSDDETDNPPVVVITSPDDGDIFKAGEEIEFEAIVADVEDAADSLDIVWESDVDGVLSTGAADADGTVGFSTDGLSVGEHIITITVTDTDGNVTIDTVVVVITENAGPTDPVVQIVPKPAFTNDALYAVLTTMATDPDGDAVSYTYSWTVDGVEYTSGSDTSTPASATVKGQTWCVTVVATDGLETSGADTDCLVVQNTPPSIDSVEIGPASPGADDVLTCGYTGFYDLDGDPDHTRYAWRVNGVYVGAGSTLSLGFGAGDTVGCTVTPNDGEADGLPLTDTVVIGNSVPVLHAVVLSPDPAYTDNSMLCSPGSTTDADGSSAFEYGFRWEVDGVTVPGATSATLGASAHAKHNWIQCFVVPSDGVSAGEAVASNRVEILNTPPTAPEISINPALPEEEDLLVCAIDVPSTDIDGDPISYSFSWTVDGLDFGGAGTTLYDGDTVASADTSAGETWICTVTPHDGEVFGPSDSAGVTIEEQCPPLGGDGFDGPLVVGPSSSTILDMAMSPITGDHDSGASTITVGDGSSFVAGDELFIQATKGSVDDCGLSDAGHWQTAKITLVDGDTLHLKDPLAEALYTADGGRYQVIRVSHFESVILDDGARLRAPAFDGQTGGVLIFRTTSLHLGAGASIDMDGRGFRGGSVSVGFGEHQGGRTAAWEGFGGDGGLDCFSPGCIGGAGLSGAGGGAGGSGGGSLVSAIGGGGGGGGGGAGQAVGGFGGVGASTGGQGGSVPYAFGASAGGGGGGPSARSFDGCSDAEGGRLLFGNGAQLGAGGGCAEAGPGGESLGGACGGGGDGGSGGGVIIILSDALSASAGAWLSADGASGGSGGVGATANSLTGGGGGGGDGGEGAHGGRILIVVDVWAAGAALLDAHADGGLGGGGGLGGAGSGLSGGLTTLAPAGNDGVDGAAQFGGGGGGGQDGANGAEGRVWVWGSWASTASFPYTPDPVYSMDFYGGESCFLEL